MGQVNNMRKIIPSKENDMTRRSLPLKKQRKAHVWHDVNQRENA